MNMQQAIETLLTSARQKGLQVDVLGVEKKSTSVAFAQRKLDQFSFSETRQLGVRVLDGRHEGLAYTESLSSDSLEEMLSEARANAKMIEKDYISTLAEPMKMQSLNDIYNPDLEKVAVEDKILAAQTLESAALDFDPRITNVAYSRYNDTSAEIWMANTLGLSGSYKKNFAVAYAYCLAKDKESNVMDGDAAMTRVFGKLNPGQVARHAAEKTLARLGSTRPATGQYTVVFKNRTAESLINMILGYFSAKAVDEKTSPLTGKLGQTLFSKVLTLVDDPFLIEPTGCRPFDEEGFASQKTTLVEDGRIANFLTNSVLAKKMKLPHTASGSRSPSTELDVSTSNVIVKPGTSTLEQLLQADTKVILINELKGFAGFRETSGDFSIPVEGELYENGKRVVALKDFLISGNILQLFSALEAVGNDAKAPLGNIVCPSLLVRGVNISGQA